MPFKESLIAIVDKLDKSASKINSINTILRKNNKLIGYNTDYHAALKILKKSKATKNSKVLLLGFGGVAKAVLKALKDLKFKDITVSARKKKKFNQLKICKNVKFCKWEDKEKLKPYLLINATPLGMFGKNEKKCPVKEFFLKDINVVYDLTVNPNKNNLEKLCKKYKIQYFSGIYSSYLQGIKQFEIYNDIKLSKKILDKI